MPNVEDKKTVKEYEWVHRREKNLKPNELAFAPQ